VLIRWLYWIVFFGLLIFAFWRVAVVGL